VKEVNVFNNQITELEIGSLEHLEYLNCGNNKLNELDVSKNIWLKVFLYFDNPLERVLGVEKLVKLK
jgi:Leucine-rich repeat (LRR) protein